MYFFLFSPSSKSSLGGMKGPQGWQQAGSATSPHSSELHLSRSVQRTWVADPAFLNEDNTRLAPTLILLLKDGGLRYSFQLCLFPTDKELWNPRLYMLLSHKFPVGKQPVDWQKTEEQGCRGAEQKEANFTANAPVCTVRWVCVPVHGVPDIPCTSLG